MKTISLVSTSLSKRRQLNFWRFFSQLTATGLTNPTQYFVKKEEEYMLYIERRLLAVFLFWLHEKIPTKEIQLFGSFSQLTATGLTNPTQYFVEKNKE